MATQFDGENLICTLDTPVGGVLTLDFEVLYKEWKQWQLSGHGNRGYPPMFFDSFGGNALVPGIDAGSYFIFQNARGWRIRPAEADHTIYPVGNLVPQDSSLPIAIPTLGAYTVIGFGLQPVTQKISADLADGLESMTYLGKEGVGIYVDPLNATGKAVDGGAFPAGNIRNPCTTEANILALEAEYSFRNVYCRSSFSLTDDHSSGSVFFGDNPQTTVVTVGDVATYPNKDASNCKFQDCFIQGEFDAANIIWECIVGDVTNANGFIYQSTINGTITVKDNISMERCWISPQAPGQECTIDFDGQAKTVIMSQWSAGRVRCINMVPGSFLGISGTGGRVVIDDATGSTITGGTVVYAGAIQVDDTYGANLDLLRDSTTASDVWDKVIEANYKASEVLKLLAAASAGKLSGAETTTVVIRDLSDTLDRIVATVDANGNRTAVTHNVS